MKGLNKILIFILCIFILTGCSVDNVNIGPKTQVTSYKEEIFKDVNVKRLNFKSQYSNMEVYCWDKNDVKFEITRRIRGIQSKDILEGKLKDFTVDIKQEEENLVFTSGYKGEIDNPIDRSLDLKMYIPKKIKNMDLKLDSGTINFLDDVDYDVKFDADMADITINRLNGKIELKSNIGNVSIKSGRIKANSNIVEGVGNINIKSEFEENSGYNIETNIGNVDLALPEKSHVSFETVGTLELNELPSSSNNLNVKVRSGMGKISIKKY
jgi:PBP1b-binding outer membrane lipoprotein LpoB